MSNASGWTAKAGKRAWFGDMNVDVLRVYKGGTATIQYWGRALLEGKLVKHRGVSVRNLSEPRKLIGGVYVENKPIVQECEECHGCGETQTLCSNCGVPLTTHNQDTDMENFDWCQKCGDKYREEET